MDTNNRQNIKLATMQKDIDYIKKGMDETNNLIRDHINSCETRYASKWTENALKLVMSAVAVTIIGAVMVLIIK